MKPLTLAAISFLCVTAIGLATFSWQSRQIADLKHKTAHAMKAVRGDGGSASHRKETIISKPAKTKSTLLDRVSEKTLASGEVIRIATDYAVATRISQFSAIAKLSATEEEAFKAAFTRFEEEKATAYLDTSLTGEERTAKLAEITLRGETWVAEQLGEERTASYKAEQALFDRAKTERSATTAVAKISTSVNLSTSQKDELYAAFLKRELDPPALPTPGMKIVPLFKVDMDPARPYLGEMEDARGVLDADQWAAFKKAHDARNQAFVAQQGDMMDKMIPAFVTTLRDIAMEEAPRASAK